MSALINKSIIANELEKNAEIAQSLYEELKVSGSSKEAFAFIVTGLNFIYGKDFTKEEFKKIITDGENDREIDAIYIHDGFLDIFDFSSTNPRSDQMITLRNSIKENFIRRPLDFRVFNERLREKLKIVHDDTKENLKMRLFVVRSSEWESGGQEMNKLKDVLESTSKGKFFYLNTESLIQKITEPEDYLEKWMIPNVCSEKIDFVSQDKKEALLRISIYELLKLKKDNDEKGFNLFNKNVRIFLNNDNLSSQISEVVDSSPELFSLYHNGIVVTTPKNIEKGSGVFIIKQPQIVNGAQTVSSLYKKYKDDIQNENLKKAKVICKIIVADKLLTNKICETSNTQIPIKPWDLRANDDIQLKLEKLINGFEGNFFYSRKGRQKRKGKETIRLDEFCQWYFSIKYRKPAQAKNKKKLIFDTVSEEGIYDELRGKLESERPENIERLCKTAILVRDKIRQNEDKDEKGFLRDADMHIIAAMYIKKYSSDEKYLRVVSVLKQYMERERNSSSDITNNFIFTKSDDAWKHLIKNI